MANLFSSSAPYVHSHIGAFERYWSSINLPTASGDATTRFSREYQERRDELTKIRDKMKDRAEAFMGTSDWRSFSYHLLHAPDTYRQIFSSMLRDKTLLDTFLIKARYIGETDEEKKRYNQYLQEFIKDFEEKTDLLNREMEGVAAGVTEKAIAEALEQYMAEFWTLKTGKDQQKYVDLMTKGMNLSVRKIGRKLTSPSGRMKAIVRKMTSEIYKGAKEDPFNFDGAWQIFETEFYRQLELTPVKSYLNKQSPEEFLKTAKDVMRRGMREGYRDTSNLSGDALEYGVKPMLDDLAVELNADFTTEVIGKKSNKAVRERAASAGRELLRNRMKGELKMAEGDIISTRKGTKVTIQAKNLLTTLERALQRDSTGKLKNVDFNIQLQGAIKYNDLVNKLGATGGRESIMTPGLLEEFGYLVANIIWFTTAGAARFNRGPAGSSKNTVLVSRLAPAYNELEKILSTILGDLLGVAIYGQDFDLNIDSANIFFLLSATQLIPTYVLIDNIRQNLDEEHKAARLRVSFGSHKNLMGVRTFYNAKRDAVGDEGFKRNGSYENPSLLGVGKSQGQTILNTLQLNGINIALKSSLLDLGNIRTSSFVG